MHPRLVCGSIITPPVALLWDAEALRASRAMAMRTFQVGTGFCQLLNRDTDGEQCEGALRPERTMA